MAKIDDSVKKKVPELRFKGFTDDWEERKLSDIVVRLNKSSNNNQLPKVEFEDIIAGEGRLNKDISRKFDDRKGTLFEPDNILYGKLRPYLKNWLFSDFKGIALGDFWVFKSINSEPKFVYSLIQADNYQRVANDTSGTKMPRSDWKKVSSSNFSIPTSLEEQQKIGSFFKQLDDTISLHQRKLDLLKEQKKGYLQKMFPKNGAKVPELRFAGFADDWEERKLGDLANIVRGASPRPIQDSKWFDKDSDIGWLRISDVTDQNGRIHHLEQRISKLGQEKTRVLKEPHLLLSIAATVGKPLVNYVKTGVHDGFLIFLNPSFEREFMFQWLEMFRPNWKKYGQPGSQVNLNSELVRNQEIPLPSIEEQQKIGSFFKQLDDTIALHQRKLDLLKEQKKGFLQKMFV
ncbi:restriction endonuclease subunit S [Lactococcus formosensis]|uniref:restriction endonuclease subunit S n=1 Tax=Lactococcus formosensis TaxID=1281486 RepID=UPI0038530416